MKGLIDVLRIVLEEEGPKGRQGDSGKGLIDVLWIVLEEEGPKEEEVRNGTGTEYLNTRLFLTYLYTVHSRYSLQRQLLLDIFKSTCT